jgi:TolB protein
MRKIFGFVLFFFTITLPYSAFAILSMELTRGVASAIPIAIVPFAGQESAAQPIADIVSNDLKNSGRFKVFGSGSITEFPSTAAAVSSTYFKKLGTDNVVIGKITPTGSGQYQVSFELMDMFRGASSAGVVLSKKYTINSSQLRAVAHHISDQIYQQLTGVRGIFSTKIAYVVVQRSANPLQSRYVLEVSDQDGYNPHPLLNSPEPIMSPHWAPNGHQIAYVTFENKQASICIQEVATGARRMLRSFPGINGAPAWSPDGRKLALVLSKSGSPNIYVMDVASGSLRQLTNDFYINTEPAWSPDGSSLLFTSNRGGGVQIYQVKLGSGAVSRISYDGDYNARGSYTADGNHIAMIHRVSGIYKIAVLDLDSGTTRVLTASSGDSASPSVAPNGSMILYDTVANGRNMLGMVSSDGRIQLVLPARVGEAQDPAWSPYLS